MCEINSIQCSFTYIPADFNVNQQYHRYYKNFGYSISEILIRKPIFEMNAMEYLRTQNIPVLSFGDSFSKTNDRLYLDMDGHWNRDGNMLAGRLLAEFINQHFTVPLKVKTDC